MPRRLTSRECSGARRESIALYYMQGLNITPVHGDSALFGVYGMLGIGLMLFSLRGLTRQEHWKPRLLSFSFRSLNVGLAGPAPSRAK